MSQTGDDGGGAPAVEEALVNQVEASGGERQRHQQRQHAVDSQLHGKQVRATLLTLSADLRFIVITSRAFLFYAQKNIIISSSTMTETYVE